MTTITRRTVSTNDSDWSEVANTKVELCWVAVTLVTTATVGNRQIELHVRDKDDNVLYAVAAGAVQGASLTKRYLFMPHVARESAFVSGGITAPIPDELYIPSGGSIRVFDSAAVDAAADDLTIVWATGDE